MSWTRTVDPVLPVLTLAEAKQQLRITHDQANASILAYIKAATDACEQHMGRGLLTQTWVYTLPRFYDVMWLPYAAPLQNDAVASPSTAPIVQYYDPDGVLQTASASLYTVDTLSTPGRLVRAVGQAWPSVQCERLDWAVKITYVVGWTAASEIPETIRQGIRMYLSYLDGDRDGVSLDREKARQAAETCWLDVVYALPPECVA